MITVDCAYPGGNIIVEEVGPSEVRLSQDLRDTDRHWFYWSFRIRGAAGLTIDFRFSNGPVIGLNGPAYSLNEGVTWQWLGMEKATKTSFTFTFPENAAVVYFSYCIPYTEAHLNDFLRGWKDSPDITAGTLCTTVKGRTVERLEFGCPSATARFQALFTCRHHACETMANYVLEGVMSTVLSDTATGRWFRDNVACMAVPFVDKDGVEDGDQGKCRVPHDHNRDYAGESIYPTTRAIRDLVPLWAAKGLDVAFDLHCPYINDQRIFLVGSPLESIWHEQLAFSEIIKRIQKSPLVFDPQNIHPFGKSWNTAESNSTNFAGWAGRLPGIKLSTTLEMPYALVKGTEVTVEAARAFGCDLAEALCLWLKD